MVDEKFDINDNSQDNSDEMLAVRYVDDDLKGQEKIDFEKRLKTSKRLKELVFISKDINDFLVMKAKLNNLKQIHKQIHK